MVSVVSVDRVPVPSKNEPFHCELPATIVMVILLGIGCGGGLLIRTGSGGDGAGDVGDVGTEVGFEGGFLLQSAVEQRFGDGLESGCADCSPEGVGVQGVFIVGQPGVLVDEGL